MLFIQGNAGPQGERGEDGLAGDMVSLFLWGFSPPSTRLCVHQCSCKLFFVHPCRARQGCEGIQENVENQAE